MPARTTPRGRKVADPSEHPWWQRLFASGPQIGGWTIAITAIVTVVTTIGYCVIDSRVASQIEAVESRLEQQIESVERRLGDGISDIDKHVGRVEGILQTVERLVLSLQDRIVSADDDEEEPAAVAQ